MRIRIVDNPEIVITESQRRMYQQKWERLCQYHVNPPSFEEYVRQQQGIREPKP